MSLTSLGSRPRVGRGPVDHRLHFVDEEQTDVARVSQLATRNGPTTDLPRTHPNFMKGADDVGLRSFATGEKGHGRRQRGVELTLGGRVAGELLGDLRAESEPVRLGRRLVEVRCRRVFGEAHAVHGGKNEIGLRFPGVGMDVPFVRAPRAELGTEVVERCHERRGRRRGVGPKAFREPIDASVEGRPERIIRPHRAGELPHRRRRLRRVDATDTSKQPHRCGRIADCGTHRSDDPGSDGRRTRLVDVLIEQLTQHRFQGPGTIQELGVGRR